MDQRISRRRALQWSSLIIAGISLSACSPASTEEAENTTKDQPLTFRFANAALAPSLDTALSGTLETARISAQVLEPLVRANINTGEPEASLATDWSISDDGLTYRFFLESSVKFQDGTDFNAAAVIKNYQRWLKVAQNTASNSHVDYLQLFSALNSQDGTSALVTGCKEEEGAVVFTLSRPSSSFLKALTQPAFGIGSPKAFNDKLEFTKFPVGTGAYTVTDWNGKRVQLDYFTNYRGEKPSVERIIFTAIPDAEKRFVAIMNDEIDAYDLVSSQNYVDLAREGTITQPRDPYSICYLTFNLRHKLLSKREIRSAIAHAVERNQLVKKNFPQGTNVADDFLPSLFMMKNKDTAAYYSTQKDITRDRLKEAGYKNEPLEFYYPTGVSLPWMMSPETIFASISADLVKAGINIKPVPVAWDEGYLDTINKSSDTRAIALTGFVGSYRDPNAFLSRVLAPNLEFLSQVKETKTVAPDAEEEKNPDLAPQDSSSTEDSSQEDENVVSYREILAAIRKADQLTELNNRREAYSSINLKVAQLMPAFPLCYPVSSVALGPRVSYYPLSATAISEMVGANVNP
ncbi:ABC transporter substrate-binding protein [uncultured Rothia sp.]|uniref:ABC transporter substrate-binding protein n=1 Tax=uncultured Rothia sp. TaxID=316088 RepID=UPI0032165F25